MKFRIIKTSFVGFVFGFLAFSPLLWQYLAIVFSAIIIYFWLEQKTEKEIIAKYKARQEKLNYYIKNTDITIL